MPWRHSRKKHPVPGGPRPPYPRRKRHTHQDLFTKKDALKALKHWRQHYNDGNGVKRK